MKNHLYCIMRPAMFVITMINISVYALTNKLMNEYVKEKNKEMPTFKMIIYFHLYKITDCSWITLKTSIVSLLVKNDRNISDLEPP